MKNKHLLLFFCISIRAAFSQDFKPIQYYYPQWSPDGTAIAFESTRDGKSSIYTVELDGKALKKVTDTVMNFGQPSWSPDGKSLVYYGGAVPMQLFLNSAKGGAQRLLLLAEYDAYEPSWSSENKLVFSSKLAGSTPNEISVMNIDKSGFVNLTYPHADDCNAPQWSPDGKKILFVRSTAIHKRWKDISDEEMQKKRSSAQLMMMNADGSDMHAILSPGFEPAFCQSRDGKTIYYINKHDTATTLYSMPLDGKPEPLLSLSGTIYSISLSPDGKEIAYASMRRTKSAIYIMDIKTTKERKLIGD